MTGFSQLVLSSDKDTSLRKPTSKSASTPTKNGNNINTTSRSRHMSEKTWKRNTAGITAHAQLRKQSKRKGVEDAIALLLRDQRPVNFHTVAKTAQVSKAYLYSQQDLRERIEALRQQEVEQVVRKRVTHSAGKTDASRDLVILAKDRRIKELEAENQKLQQQLKIALAQAYDQL